MPEHAIAKRQNAKAVKLRTAFGFSVTLMPQHIITCPNCHQFLTQHQNSWRCENNHSFDQARQGYLNLLLAQHKKSKAPGDTQDMVDARQRLLNTDLYLPISEKLNQLVLEQTIPLAQIADIGCGEGYYTNRLYQAFAQEAKPMLYGIDIAKEALKRAAKRNKQIHWLVASGSRLPFHDAGLDLLLNLFTNPMYQDYRRVLREDGLVIILSAGLKHLFELRQLIYPQVNLEAFSPEQAMQEQGFSLQATHNLSYQTKLNGQQQIMDLLLMTPHRFKVKEEALTKLKELNTLSLSIDINFYIFRADANKVDEL